MGTIFFITLLPIMAVLLVVLITMAVVGIAIFVVGVGGSIVSATTLSDAKIKAASLYFFASLLLLGLSCLAVLGGILSTVYFFIIPLLIAVGICVVVLGVIGITRALGIQQKVSKIVLVIFLSLSAAMGIVVLIIGIFMLIMS
jgi:hypothetical protein